MMGRPRLDRIITFFKETNRGRLIRLEVLVTFSAVMLGLMVILGSYRRRSDNRFVKAIVWTAYTLSYTVVSYTIGLMQSFDTRNELFLVWATFMLILLGCADSISAYNLDDNEQRRRHYARHLITFFLILWVCFSFPLDAFTLPLWILWLLSIYKMSQRIRCYEWASRSLGLPRRSKLVADYMNYEHELSQSYDATSMTGYKYLVMGEEELPARPQPPDYLMRITEVDLKDKEVITIERIMECKGKLLEGDSGKRLKDLCLSFALFKMLIRRFAGDPLAECPHKTRDFVCKGLLSDDADLLRALRVTEVELAFLYDFFYTKYHFIFGSWTPYTLATALPFIEYIPKMIRSWLQKKCFFFFFGHLFRSFNIVSYLLTVVVSCWAMASVLSIYQVPDGPSNRIDVDVTVTFFVMALIIILELWQLMVSMFSDWAKVWLVCMYVKRPPLQGSMCEMPQQGWMCEMETRLVEGWMGEKLIQLVCRQPTILNTWKNKIGQYSFLSSFSHKPRNLLHVATLGLLDKKRKGQKPLRPIKLTEEVKIAVLQCLKSRGGGLTNGVSSLKENGVWCKFNWACRLKPHTNTILVWHIATSLCDFEASQSTKKSNEHRVALSLSRYCAYLVAFAPELLPDPGYTTESIFDMAVSEAQEIFSSGCRTISIYETLLNENVEGRVQDDSIIKNGAKLGKRLMDEVEDVKQRWKVLADFWAELMLYIAPSNNATAHAEHLAQGGEFVTHLWALLSHAGINELSHAGINERRSSSEVPIGCI